MAESITWSVQLAVAGGPQLRGAPKITVDGYDLTEVHAEAGDSGTGGVLPASSSAEVLMLTATRYHPSDLTYSLGSASDVPLDGPQLFTRAMADAAFGADPDEITVTNGLDTAVTVTVLVGRTS